MGVHIYVSKSNFEGFACERRDWIGGYEQIYERRRGMWKVREEEGETEGGRDGGRERRREGGNQDKEKN
jgi:hypothetical protein